jgi:hypothetical protein
MSSRAGYGHALIGNGLLGEEHEAALAKASQHY